MIIIKKNIFHINKSTKKKSYHIFSYPFISFFILVITISTILLFKDKMNIFLFISLSILLLFVITFKKTYEIIPTNDGLRLYKEFLFLKINARVIKPTRIIKIIQSVTRRRVSARFTGTEVCESTKRLLFFEQNKESPSLEINGTECSSEDFEKFITSSINIEITKKKASLDREWKYDLKELNQDNENK